MTAVLPRGANTPLQPLLAAEESCLRVVLEYAGDNPARPSVDAIAFLLTETGKVRGDVDMVFYNNRSIPEGGIEMLQPGEAGGVQQQSFMLDLRRLPAGIMRICFCLVADGTGVQSIGQLARLAVRVYGGKTGDQLVNSELSLAGSSEAALIMGEAYLRNGEWKFKSIGQGFAAGLGALAQSYGIVVAEAAQTDSSMTRSADSLPPASATSAGRSATPPQRFERPARGFDEIVVNLVWNAVPPPVPATDEPAKKKGLLGSLVAAKPRPIDLDLCCLFELTDGYRGVVQCLGDNFGTYNSAPFVELMGDERKGTGVQGEIIRINGARWSEISRILFYAMIFDGPPNWSQASARCVLRVPDQMPISVKLDQNANDKRACSIAMVENVGGHLVVQKRVETFRNPKELDQHYNWGLRWSVGTKD